MSDPVVLRVPLRMTEDTAQRLKSSLEALLPGVPVVVLGDGATLEAVPPLEAVLRVEAKLDHLDQRVAAQAKPVVQGVTNEDLMAAIGALGVGELARNVAELARNVSMLAQVILADQDPDEPTHDLDGNPNGKARDEFAPL